MFFRLISECNPSRTPRACRPRRKPPKRRRRRKNRPRRRSAARGAKLNIAQGTLRAQLPGVHLGGVQVAADSRFAQQGAVAAAVFLKPAALLEHLAHQNHRLHKVVDFAGRDAGERAAAVLAVVVKRLVDDREAVDVREQLVHDNHVLEALHKHFNTGIGGGRLGAVKDSRGSGTGIAIETPARQICNSSSSTRCPRRCRRRCGRGVRGSSGPRNRRRRQSRGIRPGSRHAVVAGGGDAAVFLIDDPQKIIFLLRAAQQREAAVGGAVVYGDHFKIAEGLPGQRGQALREIPFRVVDRDDDADRRRLL